MKVLDHTIGVVGRIKATIMMGIEPSKVGQAVILSKSKSGRRLCNFLETIAEAAHEMPEASAISILTPSPLICSGSNISTIPNKANATANHCQPCTFSPNIGQANSITQNGMV